MWEWRCSAGLEEVAGEKTSAAGSPAMQERSALSEQQARGRRSSAADAEGLAQSRSGERRRQRQAGEQSDAVLGGLERGWKEKDFSCFIGLLQSCALLEAGLEPTASLAFKCFHGCPAQKEPPEGGEKPKEPSPLLLYNLLPAWRNCKPLPILMINDCSCH